MSRNNLSIVGARGLDSYEYTPSDQLQEAIDSKALILARLWNNILAVPAIFFPSLTKRTDDLEFSIMNRWHKYNYLNKEKGVDFLMSDYSRWLAAYNRFDIIEEIIKNDLQ